MDNITFIQLKPCNAASPYDEAVSWFMHFLHIRVRGQSCQSMKKDDTAHPLAQNITKTSAPAASKAFSSLDQTSWKENG